MEEEEWVDYSGKIPVALKTIIEHRAMFEEARKKLDPEVIRIIEKTKKTTDFDKYRMPHRTALIIDGKRIECRNYDDVNLMLHMMLSRDSWDDSRFFPNTPYVDFEFLKLFDKAQDEEKRMIFMAVLGEYITLMRHTFHTLDILYGKNGWGRFHF